MRQEIFGPVLHAVRWNGDPRDVIAQINALGYGLTIGIQTRIDSRNQIGAVVGVQPFCGEGLLGLNFLPVSGGFNG